MASAQPLRRIVVLIGTPANRRFLISLVSSHGSRSAATDYSLEPSTRSTVQVKHVLVLIPVTAVRGFKVGNLDLTIVTNGKCKDTSVDNVGTVPAAIATYAALSHFKPDLLINAGTAGGFISNGSKIGDVYISIACANHDRRLYIPGYDVYGTGRISSIPTSNLQRHLGLKAGVVSTGNSLDSTDRCLERMKQNAAVAKDMEAAAIAWVAALFKTPTFCVKAITDLVDGDRPPENEFLENLQTSSAALKTKMMEILTFIDGKTMDAL